MNLGKLPATLPELVALIDPALVLFPRFGAAFVVLPLLRKGFVSRQLQIGFMLVLSLVAYPHIPATFPVTDWDGPRWALFTVKEVFIGSLVGYSMGIMLWAIGAIGDLIDVQAGLQNAQIFNPFSAHTSGPFGLFLTQLGVLLFVGLGGLHVFLQLLYESLLLWPPASFVPRLSGALRDFGIVTSGSLLEIATRLAAPVIGALLIVELGVGLINQAAQQFNAFYFSLPIKAVTAILVLALLLSHLVDVMRQEISASSGLLKRLDPVLRPR